MVSQPAGEDVDRQVVLFLTQSEISHTEDILDQQSGMTVTLTKTDDYPADLMNEPGTSQSEVRLCECTIVNIVTGVNEPTTKTTT